MSGKGIVNSTAMPSAIVNVSSRIAAMFATTTALAAETSISDGMLALVGTTTAAAYWYDADAVSGDVLSAAGGYWKLLAYDTASLAATGGAALIGTSRSSTVEAELTTLLAGAVGNRGLQITHADLTDAVNGEAQSINIGAALPTNAYVIGKPDLLLATQFTGGSASAVVLDIGIAGELEALVKDFDAFGSTAATHYCAGASAGTRDNGYFSAGQLLATFTPDGSHTLDGLTAGDITIVVPYVVIAPPA
jgi:hypothetical protein